MNHFARTFQKKFPLDLKIIFATYLLYFFRSAGFDAISEEDSTSNEEEKKYWPIFPAGVSFSKWVK